LGNQAFFITLYVMVNQSLVTLVNSVLGTGKATSRGNYAYNCPICKHHKPKLEINMTEDAKGENRWHCWVCNARGKKLYQLFKVIEISPEILSELKTITKYTGPVVENTTPTEQKVTLPKEYKPLTNIHPSNIIGRHAYSYIKSRGITDEDILKYGIGYCETGRYANMVIIPSYDENGKLNYFTGRSFDKNSSVSYKNPVVSRDIIPFELFVNWDLPLILCEGPFDAIAIKRNVIPLLGKNIQTKLMKKIVKSSVKKIYIALDKDAQKQALEFCEQLMNEGKEVYLVDMQEKDPSEMGFHMFTSLVQETYPLTFSSLFEKKLFLG
jgi:DNA primase